MRKGFTLAELLIALVILGVIATFTIPKVLVAQQNAQKIAIAKEAASIISSAYTAYKVNHTPDGNMQATDLTPYMNYVQLQTTGYWFDQDPTSGLPMQGCSNSMCVWLHNGAILYPDIGNFIDTQPNRALHFLLDPDGTYTGNQDSLDLFLYMNGRVTTLDGVIPGTVAATYPWSPTPGGVPAWFSWN